MQSLIAVRLCLTYEPVAVVLTDEHPETAKQFKPGKWGCVMFPAMKANVVDSFVERNTWQN